MVLEENPFSLIHTEIWRDCEIAKEMPKRELDIQVWESKMIGIQKSLSYR